ncbi:hypothetical protein D3C78_1477830 [compost metagenome]
MAAQFRLFPFTGVGGHMHRYLKADACAHDPDRHAQIAGGPDGDAVVAEKIRKARFQ